MKVILKQDVKNLGRAGKSVEVAEGYARNYLIPKGFAIEASKGNVRAFEHEEGVRKRKEAREMEDARRTAERLASTTIVIPTKTGEGGKLFGSVTAKDVADGIKGSLGLEVDKKKIELQEPIKAVGSYVVPVRLHQGVDVDLRVEVVAG